MPFASFTLHPLLAALLVLGLLAFLIGLLLGYAQVRFFIEGDPLAEKIDQLLPQTQCGQCGYPGCKPYAAAIAQGEAINKCPPGGEETMLNLADLLGRDPLPLAETTAELGGKKVAWIREEECIGCTKCIQACPVDAILGAAKQMHTVIADECTGCDLCVAPCPVDCIDMLDITPPRYPRPAGPWTSQQARLIATDLSPLGSQP